MDVKKLKEFIYLAETLSFSETARHFFISASVFSKHVNSLESELGVKLLDRDRHHVELTAAGKCFYRDAIIIVNDCDRAIANLEAVVGGSRKLLRVGYLRGAAGPFLPEFVRYCEERYPNIELALTCMEFGELVQAQRSHKVDVGINLFLDEEARFACKLQRIYEDRFFLVVGKDHPLAWETEGVSVELGDLSGENLILPDQASYPGMTERLERIVRGMYPLESCERYRDVETMFLRVSAGGCVAFTSGHNMLRAEEDVVFLPLLGVDSSYEVGALWLNDLDGDLASKVRDIACHCMDFMDGWPGKRSLAHQSEKDA